MRYYFKGKKYKKLVKSKIKLDGTWQDIVIYKSMYFHPDGKVWARLKEDFYKNFEPRESWFKKIFNT